MRNDVDEVRKIIHSILEIDHIHANHKVLEIIDETRTTYDGTYPSFEIVYKSSGNNLWIKELQKQIILKIETYTGLRHNTDFWFGVSDK
jgi:hypothetical protein